MNSLYLSVQSAITSVSFPRTLVELRDMCLNWLEAIGEDWITDLDVLRHFSSSGGVTWIAPKWLSAGDLLFSITPKAQED